MFTQEWLTGINETNCIEGFITMYRAIEVKGKIYVLQNFLGRNSDAYISSYVDASKKCKIIISQFRDS